MGEDQSVNGDRWNIQASNLLSKLGWTKHGDLNMDLEGTDGKQYGIDAFFSYLDPSTGIQEGIFVDSKSYKSTSFTPSIISGWVDTIQKKIRKIPFNERVQDQFPIIKNLNMRNCLLMVYIRDIENYQDVVEKIQSGLREVQVRRGRSSDRSVKIFYLDNQKISRLISMIQTLKEEDESYQFYYPAFNRVAVRTSDVLNFEGIFSNFVIMRQVIENNPGGSFKIFYWGKPTTLEYTYLVKNLSKIQVLQQNYELTFHYYESNDDFRKIQSDIEKIILDQLQEIPIQFKEISRISNLPSWMKEGLDYG